MESWTLWVIVALIMIIIEIFTLGFAVICISIGALAAAFAAYIDLDIEWQLLAFAISTTLAFVTVRPMILRIFGSRDSRHSVETNVNALLGREATVSHEIQDGEGRVKIDGDDWKAITTERQEVIPRGSKVVIIEVNSVILTVKKI